MRKSMILVKISYEMNEFQDHKTSMSELGDNDRI